MKKEHVWVCDYCGKEFSTKKKCDKHELGCPKRKNRYSKLAINFGNINRKKIFNSTLLFLVIYLMTYGLINSYAKVNSLTPRNFFKPSEWLGKKNKNIEEKNIPTPVFVENFSLSPTVKTELTSTSEVVKQQANNSTMKLPVLNGGNIFSLVNAYRASNDKPFLSVSDELCRLAEIRADYMMSNRMTAFKSSETGGHTGLINVSSQYSGGGVGENLAANVDTDASVIEIWKTSTPHRELMLWTEKDGTPITKGCIATRVSEIGSIVVLLVGDK